MAAIAKQHLRPIFRALKRRSILPGYFDLNGKGLFVLVVLGASLLALLALAQTGRVVSVAYQMKDLQKQEQQLRWEQEDLLEQIARATNPVTLEQWAREHKMEPLVPGDTAYIPLPQELNRQADQPQPPLASQP